MTVLSLIGMSDAEIEGLRASKNPDWSTRTASAWTLPREATVEAGWSYRRNYRPGQFDTIEAFALVLVGSASLPERAEATGCAARAIPGARISVLDNHGYMADNNPILVAELIGMFVSTEVRA